MANGLPRTVDRADIPLGPSIALTLRERLDHFGTTANVAVRVGNLTGGTETVFAGTYSVRGVTAILTQHSVESFQASVRGIDRQTTYHRLPLSTDSPDRLKWGDGTGSPHPG